MNSQVYPFQIGAVECTIVNDGTFAYPQPGQLFFDDVPANPLTRALQKYPPLAM